MEWSLWPAMGGAVAAFCVFLASTWLATMAVGVFYALGREAALGLLTLLAVLLILALGLLRRSKNGLFSPALLLAAPFVLLGLLAPVRLALGPWYTTSKLGAEKAPVTNDKQKAPSFPAVQLPGLAKEDTPTKVRYYHLFRRFRLSTTRFNTQRFELDAERGESATFTLLSQDPITPSPELLHPPFGNYRYHEGRFYREVSPDVITKPNLKGVKQVAFTGYLTGVEDDLLQLRDLPSSFGFTEQLADGTKGERQIPCGVRCPTPELREELAGKANQAVWLCGEHKPAFDKDGKLLSIHLELASVLPAPVTLPSVRHWLGTDRDGRDVLARMIHGARVSISVGFVAVGLYVLIGIFLGGLAGYYRGIVDILISRLIELMICFPTFFLILTIIAFMEERSIFHVMLVMGLTGWPGIARLVRGEFLKLAEQDFVHAARALGCSGQRVMFRHILPNALGPVLVSAAFGIAGAVLTESGLAFLGFGAPPPTPTWGEMIRQGYDHVTQGVWWLFVFPGFSIFLTVTVYNEAGDGLRDAMDPRLRK